MSIVRLINKIPVWAWRTFDVLVILLTILIVALLVSCGSDDDVPSPEKSGEPEFTLVFDPATGNTLSCLQQSGVIVWCSP